MKVTSRAFTRWAAIKKKKKKLRLVTQGKQEARLDDDVAMTLKKCNFSLDLLRVGQNLHIRKVYMVNEVPGLELRDELSVCISVASWRNYSILNTTFYVSA